MGVPVNGADFGADRAFEAGGPEVFLSLPPIMLAALVVLGLALFALGWFLKESQGPRRRDDAEAIWKAIDDALKAAMKADGAALVGQAEALKKVLSKRLGATLKLAGGLGGLVTALDHALAGEPHEAHRHGGHGHGHGDPGHDDHGHGHGHDDHKPQDDHGKPGPVTHVTIINGPHAHGDKGGHGGHGHDDHKPASLSPRDRDRALRLAVADLNEHWRHKAERIGELRAACRELSAD